MRFPKRLTGSNCPSRDLQLRGPGDFFGTRQSGLPTLRVGDLLRDHRIMEEARKAAHAWLHSSSATHDLLQDVKRGLGGALRTRGCRVVAHTKRSTVRVIAGLLKGRRLEAPQWAGLRPTSDGLRETLFNILFDRPAGARVLDACAGTGALGIEALSRGAHHVVFIDDDRRATDLVTRNLEHCGVAGPVSSGVRRAAGNRYC